MSAGKRFVHFSHVIHIAKKKKDHISVLVGKKNIVPLFSHSGASSHLPVTIPIKRKRDSHKYQSAMLLFAAPQ